MRIHLPLWPLTLVFTALVLGFATSAIAQDASGEPPSYAVVTADDVNVRSGPADSYYPFGRIQAGDVVKVIGEKNNWDRVAVQGPVFRAFFGFIKYSPGDTTHFRLNDDGVTGLTLGRMHVLAPNLNTNFNPTSSWKPLLRLDADVTVQILQTFQTDDEVVHKIALPKESQGWVSKSLLREATASEVEAWGRIQRGEEPVLEEAPHAAAPVSPREEQDVPPVEDIAPLLTPPTVPVETVTPTAASDANTPRTLTPETELPAPVTTEAPRQLTEEETRLDELEEVLKVLLLEPLATAEVQPLQNLYRELGQSATDPTVIRYAKARTDQLQIWNELQQRKTELAVMRRRLERTADDTRASLIDVQRTHEYVSIGRLSASIIYDGRRLPKLFRLQDNSGRTIAYLRTDDEFDLSGMLGQLVGVFGNKNYDGGLRLNIITPTGFDILAPRSTEVGGSASLNFTAELPF